MFEVPKCSILAVGSHPDDIEFGCGGTLSRFVDRGNDVYLLVMTDGCAGGETAQRKDEQMASAEVLGVKEVFWGDYPDTRTPFHPDVIPRIEEVVRKVGPTFVFVHYGNDTHQDHRHVSACTVAATRTIPNVLFYEGPTTFGFEPNVFVDMKECLDTKFACLKRHASQVMRTNIQGQSIEAIARATATFRGTMCHIQSAEAFASLRMMFLLP